jgi:hypothetical protein
MSESEQAVAVAGTPAPVATPVAGTPATVATPAPKLTAIQVIEQELGNFFRQKEQAVANMHAIDGAIQGAHHLLAKLRQEAAKAEAVVEKVVEAVEKAL